MHAHRSTARPDRARLRAWRDASPLAAPRALDAVAEWWARRPPRHRQALRLVAGLTVAGAVFRPDATATATVLVARHDLAAGGAVTTADVVEQQRPRSMIPPRALRGEDLPADATLTTALGAGGVLTGLHVAPFGPVDRTPAGHVALAVPLDELPSLPPGTIVDLHGGDGGSVLGAVILGPDGDALWVGVPRERAAVLVASLAWGPIRVAVVPPEAVPDGLGTGG